MSDSVPEDEDRLLAAEYVLGVLSGPERRLVAARAEAEPVLAGEISFWENRLMPLAALVRPVAPPAFLWQRLQYAIGADPARGAVRRWRTATFASLAVAAALLIIAVLPRAPRPIAIAAIAPLHQAAPAFVARVLPSGAISLAAIAPDQVPPGRDLQLWALPQGAVRPVSLGVIAATGAHIPPSHLTAPGGKLLVSLEPKGGSPTGQPTGPVLYGGTITRL